jgi:hypothetical protein
MLEVSILRLHGQVQPEMFLQDGLLMKCLVMEMLTLRQDTETMFSAYMNEASAAAAIVILSKLVTG